MMDGDKIAKLARVALDCRTPAGEAEAALSLIRAQQLHWCEVIRLLIENPGFPKAETKPLSRRERQSDFCDSRDDIVMPWGKHRGLRLSELMEDYPWYLPYLLDKCDWISGRLRSQMQMAVDIFG